jgi:CRISPR-associated endonuclease Csn1
METELVLGLDLGTNSAGWALIEQSIDSGGAAKPARLVDAGVRIFPEGIEAKLKESRNVARRAARGMRRQHDRRNRRRDALRHRLQRAGLLPSEKAELALVLARNPYALRARGLDEKLEPFDLGRALYHLGNRRGFLSNRKTERGKEKKDEKKIVQAGITDLQRKIEEAKARTLGEYLSKIDPFKERIRCRYTSRKMYEDEFDALWDGQRSHHPALLTDDLRRRIRETIFNQRPLKVQKDLVGNCELEPNRKRAPKGLWYAQQFRLLQDVSHLEFPDAGTGEIRKLNDGERTKLVAELQRRKEMIFDQIRTTLGLLESQKFNFETADHRDKLKGNQTEWRLRKDLKKSYDQLSATVRDEIVHELIFVEDHEVIRRHAIQRWALSPEAAENLKSIELESGYLHLSEKALRKLIPHLERGLDYMSAVVAAGYERPDQRKIVVREELTRADLPELRNPIVTMAMNQIRRLVNAIIRKYGKPARIRVEMARELKVSLRRRSEILLENKKHGLENEAASALLKKEFGVSNPTRDDLLRHRLWKEQKQTCPYTGQAIAQGSLFSADWEIDHIIPVPRSGDDSYMNKVLCAAAANRAKLARTPWEVWGGDEKRWGDITLRITNLHLPFAKKRRFLTQRVDEEFLENFINRQLNDTRYIAREARSYLETLTGKFGVQIGIGVTTAALRRRWGLNSLLSDSVEKTRADHRHHAIDAAVIALTTPAVVKRMSQLSALGRRPEEAGFAPPWEHFRDDVKRKIETMLVSHQTLRGLRGALHEETNYGITGLKDEKGQELFAVRKSLDALTQSELGRIADKNVRAIVKAHLCAHGADPEVRNAEKTEQWKKAMTPPNYPMLPNGNGAPIPIKKVRLHKPSGGMIRMKNREGVEYRAVESGSNHHIVIFEYTEAKKKGRWDGEVVSMFEAAQRIRRHEPIIRRDMGVGKKFVMSLSINEIVRVVENGTPEYWRVQKIAGDDISFRPHTDARKSDGNEFQKRMHPINKLKVFRPVKVTIDPLGREHPAHD